MRSRLFGFPNPVNETSARLVAGGVVLQGLAYLAFRQWWQLIPLAYGFLARVLTGPRLSPLGQFVTRVVTPRIGGEHRFVAGPPNDEKAAYRTPNARLVQWVVSTGEAELRGFFDAAGAR